MGTTLRATAHAKRCVICLAGCRRRLRLSLSTDRRANMDVLVSLGTNASYAYSIISILHHHLRSHVRMSPAALFAVHGKTCLAGP